MVKTMVRQAVVLKPMEVRGGTDIHLQPVEYPTPEKVDAPKEAVNPRKAHTKADSLQHPGACGGRGSCWNRFAGRTCGPVGDPCWNSLFLKDCTLQKGPTLDQFVKNCSL
ncbi:suppression of tumorigenicity 5 protein isoform x4 [Limosa lapponica baueri]|uniref:Suppression of tumorigenicity 5 protein isoform x4 n=1 Tax=Limosa lapponica baueri TaxID=1758121 RepID=A0A2I0ULT2_LIMLA|nr:suppression of tumorigenicity 5 protein isoform x4 [Limosa lapponica baueri]